MINISKLFPRIPVHRHWSDTERTCSSIGSECSARRAHVDVGVFPRTGLFVAPRRSEDHRGFQQDRTVLLEELDCSADAEKGISSGERSQNNRRLDAFNRANFQTRRRVRGYGLSGKSAGKEVTVRTEAMLEALASLLNSNKYFFDVKEPSWVRK